MIVGVFEFVVVRLSLPSVFEYQQLLMRRIAHLELLQTNISRMHFLAFIEAKNSQCIDPYPTTYSAVFSFEITIGVLLQIQHPYFSNSQSAS
jgi:hypothetical protein